MSSYTRTINSLEDQNQNIKKLLSEVEIRIGKVLFAERNSAIEEVNQASYDTIVAQIQKLEDDCDSIDTHLKRLDNLNDAITDENKKLKEISQQWSVLFLALGKQLYANYSQSLASTFGTSYSEISALQKQIDDTTEQQSKLKTEMESQGFFSKLLSQAKIASSSASINSLSKKRDATLIQGAKSAYLGKAVINEIGGDSFIQCERLKGQEEEIQKKISILESEKNDIHTQLQEMGKKSKIEASITEKKEEIDQKAKIEGHEFTKKYVTRDADILADFPPRYDADLKIVLEYKKQLASINRRLEILNLSAQVDAAEKTISSMKDEIKTNEAKLTTITQRNADLSKRIKDAKTAEDELKARRSAIEIEEGVSVSRLTGGASKDISEKSESSVDDTSSEGTINSETTDNNRVKTDVMSDHAEPLTAKPGDGEILDKYVPSSEDEKVVADKDKKKKTYTKA